MPPCRRAGAHLMLVPLRLEVREEERERAQARVVTALAEAGPHLLNASRAVDAGRPAAALISLAEAARVLCAAAHRFPNS